MNTSEEVQGILSVALTKYKSFEKPLFFFVTDVEKQRPYDAIIKKLEKNFTIQETTDTNVDVSFQYLLETPLDAWSLQLSMVGSYATLWKIVKPYEIFTIIDRDTKNLLSLELQILDTLKLHNITVLSEQMLIQPVSVQLFLAEPGNTFIYHLLFSDYDGIPWKN